MQKLGLLALCAAILCGAGSCLAADGGVTVSNVSIKVLGTPDAGAPAWAVGTTYVQGQYAKAHGRSYFCLVPGTNALLTGGPSGVGDVTDGSTTWRSCLSRPRKGVFVVNDSSVSTNLLYLGIGEPAVVSQGLRLNAGGGTIGFTGTDAPQDEIFAITTSTAATTVPTLEW